MTPLPELVAHATWANRAWLLFIADRFAPDEWLRRRLSHVLLAERVWFQRVGGEEPGRDIWALLAFAEIETLLAGHERIYAQLLEGDLDRVVPFQRFTGETCRSPVADILVHLMLHGEHHRGQMAAHVSARRVSPINTDFIEYRRLHQI